MVDPTPATATGRPSTPDRRRRRRIRLAIASIGLCGFVAVMVLTACWVWVLAAFVDAESTVPWAAEPTVIEVIDGDTVLVRIGRDRIPVRLLGIDTPETKDPRRSVECFGPEATERTRQLLPRGTVLRLAHDVEERDAYDRLLAYAWRASDGLFVNLDLVTNGFADILPIAPNTLHADEFRAARDRARAASIGLWQDCGGTDRPAA